MKIVNREKLEKFSREHADARSSVKAWLTEVEKADWKNPSELKARYPKASIVADNHVYFDIRGGHYRLEVLIAYNSGVLIIEWIGTHVEYMRRLKGAK